MCTVLLPPGDNPIAVNKYIISYALKAQDLIKYIFTLLPVQDLPSKPIGIYGSFPEIKDWGMKLTSHQHLVPNLRIRGDEPPLPHIPSCLIS